METATQDKLANAKARTRVSWQELGYTFEELMALDDKLLFWGVANMADRYKIVRNYFKKRSRVIERGLTLEQAQEHCRNPETSSRTARSSAAKAITRRNGEWFDGYERE